MKGCVCVVCILLLGSSVDGREHWGPPPLCPPPKADCCPKPCPPKPCKPAPKCEPCTPKCEPQPNCCKKSQCETPCPQRCQDLSPAFNQCAAINIDCGWNVWMDTSFIYFEAMEDNLELAIRANGDPSTILTHGPSDGSVVGIDYSYEPGFKVGIGLTTRYDCWDVFAEYTWFRSTVTQSATAPSPGVLLPMAGNPFVSASHGFNALDSRWHTSLDVIDGRMGRWHYVGKKLTFHPYFGVRAAWIDQDWDTTYTNTILDPHSVLVANQATHSWGVGPEVGIDTQWQFCYGLRLYGNAEVDVLFTRYTTLKTLDTNASVERAFDVTQHGANTLRAHLDLEMGLGWGTYLRCHKWYLDLSAGYGFQIFFDQNMFREYQVTTGFSSFYGGNLYIHGLTVTAKLEF